MATAVATQQPNGHASEDLVSHADDPLLTFSEAAQLIGRSPSTVRGWAEQGLIAAVRDPSGLRRVRQSEFVKFYGATAMAKAAEEKQERLNRTAADRQQWRKEIERDGKAFDRKRAKASSEEE